MYFYTLHSIDYMYIKSGCLRAVKQDVGVERARRVNGVVVITTFCAGALKKLVRQAPTHIHIT